MVARYLGVHDDHIITRRAGVGPEVAASLREGWRRGSPRIDLVSDDLLDELVAAGTLSDAVRAFDRLEAAGLDVVVVRDDPAVDPKETLRQAHAIMRTRR